MERLGLDRLHVTVVVAPGHKEAVAPAEYRLELARLAFAGLGTVEPELYEYTVDALEAHDYEDPVFLIGADELADFPTWKEPERVLELARLGVATRPGYRPEATSPRDRDLRARAVRRLLVRDPRAGAARGADRRARAGRGRQRGSQSSVSIADA